MRLGQVRLDQIDFQTYPPQNHCIQTSKCSFIQNIQTSNFCSFIQNIQTFIFNSFIQNIQTLILYSFQCLCLYRSLCTVKCTRHTCTPYLTHMYSPDTHPLMGRSNTKLLDFYVFPLIMLKFLYSIVLMNCIFVQFILELFSPTDCMH